ncbi:MAG: aldose 1-epimerase family protein [Saprospiraceae bacterium]|nr:aldose 1-epimerase family protein [Saprospiraceae bacterium]
MEKYSLQNERLLVEVNRQGAELARIQSKETGLEYLWEADPTYWGRHSSILYPIVGRVFGDQYQFQGKTFQMKQHGVARNLPFDLVEADPLKLELILKSDESTLAQYPFEFVFRARYQLTKNELAISYLVENPTENTAFFSVGAHPAFRCPLLPGEQRSDYRLVFDQTEHAERQLLEGGFRTGMREGVLEEANELAIVDHLFDEDALIFAGLRSQQVSLENKAGQRFWTFDFSGFPYLGIWSKNAEAPFVCIEPWFGVADKLGGYSDLKEKEGILALEGGKSFQCTHKVKIL